MNRIIKSVFLLMAPLMGVAAPVTSDEAAQAVKAWVGMKAQLGCRLGAAVSGARTCAPTNGVTFHVVKLEGGGFVVTSSDTETEPILAFSESDDFVESERNPLWTMLRRDLSACARRRRQVQFASAGASVSTLSAPAAKWARLLPAKGTNGLMRVLQAATGKDTLSDMRVAPLLQTKWNQEQDAYYSNMGDPCYNYYTPNNFPCGCVATATAQIMRYHRFPTGYVTSGTYACRVETGKNWIDSWSYYSIYEDRDLTMQGGYYEWDEMPLVPADGTTLAQRQAIGKLTSDVGITCLMSYGEYGSSSGGYMAARSLPERFGYASAVAACGGISADIVRKALVSNLDAKLPVLLGVSGGSGGHAVVADGYGYSLSTFYAHFNLGWGGRNDAWYAPPNIEDYNSVDSMVYNIYPSGVANGVICSGRVLSQSGTPVNGATVAVSGKASASAVTDANGVYAFILAPGSYEVSSGDASRSVTLVANVGTSVTDNGYYYSSPVAKVNNVCDLDLTVSGTVPPQEEDPPEEEPVVSGVRAGAWTTDVDAVRAASDCRMVVVLCANYGGCGWSQRAQPVFESKKFLDWAAENGVYLVTSDSSRLPTGCTDADDADSWFWTLYWSVSHPDGYVYWPTIAVVRPDNFTQAVGYDVVRDDGECTVGGLVYEGTADSLIAGLSAYLGRKGNPTCKIGAVSEFALSAAMGGGRARVVGVANLMAEDFRPTLYKGNTWDMNGKPPKTDRYYLCFTGDNELVDVEKDATFGNKDDYWCSEFTDLNLAYYGGWIPKSKYATVDAAAKDLRDAYKAEDWNITFRWLNGKLSSFGLAGKGDVADYLVQFDGEFYEEEFHQFLAEQLDNAKRLVYLNANGHAITCCGYSVGEDGCLNGLFVIDSDNDMFNGGGAKAPNRIMFCPLDMDYDGWLMIANIFAEEWTPLMMAYALKSADEPKDPKAVFDAADGWVFPSEKPVRVGEPFGELPVPERTGYTFVAWWNESYGGEVTADTIVRSDEVVVLSARWMANTYSVCFDANGGEGWMPDLTDVAYDMWTALPPCSFFCDDTSVRFRGWATEPEGRVVFRDCDPIVNLASEDGDVVTLYAVWGTASDGFDFDTREVFAEKGGVFELVVYGGSDETAASVKLNVAYGSAKAADLVLKNATVSGAGGVEMANLKFPLTLSWAQGDIEPKTIVIPVAAGKATDAPKFLTWNLTDALGLELGETACCIGTIAAGEKWSGEDVYVMPTVADASGGKVSGGAGVKPDKNGAYKPVTLKATPGKGYWFAGWYDADGEWASGDLSFKVTPDGSGPLSKYEARFVPAQPSLSGTYNGYARVNMRGMTVVKGADTSKDAYGDYPVTVTLSTAGKVSGSLTVGGKKVSFKTDCCDELFIGGDGSAWAGFRATLDEKLWFGVVNPEIVEVYLSNCHGMASWMNGLGGAGEYAPLSSDDSFCWMCRDRLKDAAVKTNLKTLAGTYAAYAADDEGHVVPLSIVVDTAGKAKIAGKFYDGTALSASVVLGGYEEDTDGTDLAEWWTYGEAFLSVKSLGGGNLHLQLCGSLSDGADRPDVVLQDLRVTSYSADLVAADPVMLDDRTWTLSRFDSAAWFPVDADPDFGVVRLTSGEDTVDILYASKNGKITGLGKATSKDYAVKFDAKTGLLIVTKGKEYTIQGVLGDYEGGCYQAGRINKDGTCEPVGIEFTTLPTPEESFPWANDGFELALGQTFGEGLQPSVWSGDELLELTVTGLPAGLKYDKKTGLITGAPTKAGEFKVKVGYSYGTRKIARETTLVVLPKPEGLPGGTYAGYATVYVDGTNKGQRVDCPFTATIDKNGALSGSITLFGKKATFKASGYDCGSDGSSDYTATLDLKAVDKAWGTTALSIWIEGDEMSADSSGPFGDGVVINGVVAHRNQTKDTGYADRVAPYVGTYVAALSTAVDAARYGVTTLSVAVDKKGTAKLAGTFADGTAFSGSAPLVLSEGPDGELASVDVSVAPKSLAQGALRISLSFYEENGAVALTCSAITAKYARTAGEYVESSLVCDSAYRYASLAWVDRSVNPKATCLSVRCEKGSFDEALFAWKTKMDPICGPEITGIDKKLLGPSMMFKIDDKTGLFSGTCGSYKIFGAMGEGSCSGIGTAVGKDGSVDWVWVEVAEPPLNP